VRRLGSSWNPRYTGGVSLLDLIDEKRPEILRLAAKHGASDLRLFGSVARGEDHEGSDVDLLVKSPSYHEQFTLHAEIEQLLGVKVDLVDGVHPEMEPYALAEAIPLDAPDFRERAVLESHRPHMAIDRDAFYLRRMVEHAAQVIQIGEHDHEVFVASDERQLALIMTLVLIGEAANHVSPAVQQQHPEIEWSDIVAFRNLAVHEYWRLNLDDVWKTIEYDIPKLQKQLEVFVSPQP
jgi:uncharacterized protein